MRKWFLVNMSTRVVLHMLWDIMQSHHHEHTKPDRRAVVDPNNKLPIQRTNRTTVIDPNYGPNDEPNRKPDKKSNGDPNDTSVGNSVSDSVGKSDIISDGKPNSKPVDRRTIGNAIADSNDVPDDKEPNIGSYGAPSPIRSNAISHKEPNKCSDGASNH